MRKWGTEGGGGGDEGGPGGGWEMNPKTRASKGGGPKTPGPVAWADN